jgi:hypothetical protein
MFGEWLEKEKLDFDKGDRSRLLDIMDRLPAIESWRNTLTRIERRADAAESSDHGVA